MFDLMTTVSVLTDDIRVAVETLVEALGLLTTEIAMPEAMLLELSDHLQTLGVPHGFAPADSKDRFFMDGDPAVEYDRSADTGLVIEAGSSGHLGLPEDAFGAPADIPKARGRARWCASWRVSTSSRTSTQR